MKENFATNNCIHCIPEFSSEPPATENKFDIILANINRNVILEFLPSLKKLLKPNAIIFCSGFLPIDEQIIIEAASENNLKLLTSKTRDNWSSIIFSGNF